jgi:hypothetical protein
MFVHEELNTGVAVEVPQGSYRHSAPHLMIAADGQHVAPGGPQGPAKLRQHWQRLPRAKHIAGEHNNRRGPRLHGSKDLLFQRANGV